MSEIEKYYNGEIIVDFEEETELEKKYNEVAELYSKNTSLASIIP